MMRVLNSLGVLSLRIVSIYVQHSRLKIPVVTEEFAFLILAGTTFDNFHHSGTPETT